MTTGLDLREARLRAGVTGPELGQQMGYSGPSPHSRIYHLEGQRNVTDKAAARYMAALAAVVGRKGS